MLLQLTFLHIFKFRPNVYFNEGLKIQKTTNCNSAFQKIFSETLRTNFCLFTNGSKMNAEFGGFAVFTNNVNYCPR